MKLQRQMAMLLSANQHPFPQVQPWLQLWLPLKAHLEPEYEKKEQDECIKREYLHYTAKKLKIKRKSKLNGNKRHRIWNSAKYLLHTKFTWRK